jgi:hypothetical protein
MADRGDETEEMRRLRRQLAGEDVRDAARALLAPGETLRELGEVTVAYGDTGPVSDWQPVALTSPAWFDRIWSWGTRSPVRKAVFFTLLAPVAAVAALDSIGPSTLMDRLIGGRVCEGPRGSTARQIEHALSALGPGGNRIAITDRRILLLRQALFADPPDLNLLLAVPLTDIAAANRKPRGFLRRRVELRFVDGTRVVLALPTFGATSPRRLLAALTH